MAVVRDNSQQTTANMNVVESDGSRKTAVCASCHIRPGRGMTITLDLMEEAGSISAENMEAVRQNVADYMAEEITKAAALGVPVAMPTAATGNK